jgi:hypothetical protein
MRIHKVFLGLFFVGFLFSSCAEQFREIHGSEHAGNPFRGSINNRHASQKVSHENKEQKQIEISAISNLPLEKHANKLPLNDEDAVKVTRNYSENQSAESGTLDGEMLVYRKDAQAKSHKITGITKINKPSIKKLLPISLEGISTKSPISKKGFHLTKNEIGKKSWDLGNWFIFLVGLIYLILGVIFLVYGLTNSGYGSFFFIVIGLPLLIWGILGLSYFQKIYNNFKNHSLLFKIAFWMMYLGIFLFQFWLFFLLFYWIMAILDWAKYNPNPSKRKL